MKSYEIGFSPLGFIVVMLVMLPNFMWLIAPPHTLIETNSNNLLLILTESILRLLMIACFLFLKPSQLKEWKISRAALLFLSLYYLLWVLLYIGIEHTSIYLGLALFPSLYFVSVGYQLKNNPAMLFAIFFSVIHIGVTIHLYY